MKWLGAEPSWHRGHRHQVRQVHRQRGAQVAPADGGHHGLQGGENTSLQDFLEHSPLTKLSMWADHAHKYFKFFCKIMFQSVTPSRIEENFKIWDFSLSPEDMAVFDKMNVGWRHLLWAETSMHPDYPFKVAAHIGIVI